MRFRISARASTGGWILTISRPDRADWVLPERSLTTGTTGYPSPPPVESAALKEGQLKALCVASDDKRRSAIHKNITVGNPDPKETDGDVELFGRYLFAVLLGAWWPAVQTVAPEGAIELELAFEATDGLQRLPWEMMAAPDDGLLAAVDRPGRRIAFTRLITTEKPVPAAPLTIPLRVLFVVGRQLDNALRPGAEYLALMRQFKVLVGSPGNTAVGVGIQVRLLVEATSEELARQVDEFKPSVVHVVAHGRWNGTTPEVLLTKYVNKKPEEDACPPERLFKLLRGANGATTSVQFVVLNACHTGEPNDPYVSYAAKLIHHGISVTVGMSGEVSDHVCRIFVRSFYQALIEARNIATAVADGRRAALLHYKHFRSNVEWVRPVLFRNNGTEPVFSVDTARQELAKASSRFRRRNENDLLCDRMDAFRIFQTAFSDTQAARPSMMAFEVDEDAPTAIGASQRAFRLGKTWLLEEFAWLSVLDGYLPCMLRSGDGVDPSPNLMLFAIQLAEAMDVTRERFELPKRNRSAALDIAFQRVDEPIVIDDTNAPAYLIKAGKVRKQVRSLTITEDDVPAIEAAMEADIVSLLTDIRQKLGPAAAPVGVLVMVDDLHRYEGVEAALMNAVSAYGLGTLEAPAPLVFTYATRQAGGPKILELLKKRSADVQRAALRPFQSPVESRLAYRQYLLSRKLMPTSNRDSKKYVDELFNHFDKKVQGIPSYFESVEGAVEYATDSEVLVMADDEEILKVRHTSDGNGKP